MEGQLADAVLSPFDDMDDESHALLGAFLAHFRDGDIDVALVLVKLAHTIEILLQLGLIEPAGFVEERDEGLGLCLHLAAEDAIAKFHVAFEGNRAHRTLLAFVDGVNCARRAPAFIRRYLQLHVDAGEAFALIKIDDVLAAFLQFLRVARRGDPELDFVAQRPGFEALGAIDLDLGHQRPRGEDDLHMDAVAPWFAKDADVLNLAGIVERADVVFHRRLGIRGADFRPHVGEDAILGHGLGADVANVDRGDGAAIQSLGTRALRERSEQT